MKLLFASAAIITAASLLTSCDDNNPSDDHVTDQSLTGYINIITDTDNGQVSYIDGTSYSVQYNYGKSTAEIRISGLSLPDKTAYPTLTTQSLKWKVDNEGWRLISASSVATSAKNYGQAPELKNFIFNLFDYWYDEKTYSAITQIKYDLGRYHILSMPKSFPTFGNTTVKDLESGYVYETDRTVYGLEIYPEQKTANIVINNFRLNDDLWMRGLAIRDLPLVLSPDGDITIESKSTTGIVVGNEDSSSLRMPVTNLSLSFSGKTLTLKYTIVSENRTYDITVK